MVLKLPPNQLDVVMIIIIVIVIVVVVVVVVLVVVLVFVVVHGTRAVIEQRCNGFSLDWLLFVCC